MKKINNKSKIFTFSRLKRLKKKRYSKLFFFNFNRIISLKKRWDYSSKSFKNNLTMRNRVNCYFDGVFPNSFFKKIMFSTKTYPDLLRNCYIKPEFRLDILLWRLNFFVSPYASRIAIRNNKVLVNNEKKEYGYFLKEGDIIYFNDFFNLNNNLCLRKSSFLLNSFVEIDYLTKVIFILQNSSSVSMDSFSNVLRDSFRIKKHVNYLRRV